MATYTIGSGVGADYATFSAFFAAVTLPEVGGTRLEITGTVTDSTTFANGNFVNGLTIAAKAGEEADGIGGGAFMDASHLYSIISTQLTIENIRVRKIDATGFTGSAGILNNLDIGENATDDPFLHNSGASFTISNSIIRPALGSNDDGIYSPDSNNTNAIFNKVTVVGATRIGAARGVFTDCLAIGAGSLGDFFDQVAGSDYNASEDLTAPGTTVFTGRTTADLNNYAGGDYNLASGSSLNTAGSAGGRIGALLTAAAAPSSDTNPITLESAATEITINTMIAEAVTTSGSVFEAAMITVEDNMQATIPLQIALPTTGFADMTLTADGVYGYSYSGGGTDEAFDIPVKYYSPANLQESTATITTIPIAADTPPTSPANQAVNVTEGNTAVGNTSTATGTAPMTYSKGGTDAASFNVNSTTGALTFITAPDYETKTSYSVTVVANNTFGTDSHIVTVTILNALEETITAPTPANVGYGYGEAGVPHTDSGLLAWLATASVTGGGAVTNNLAAQADPLVSPTVITFSASDAANQTATVTPTEAAPTAPVMPATATRNVAQPNQLMGVYVTSNTPIPAVTYTLTGTDAGLLSINGSTGSVTANSPTSVAGKSSYSFNVVATNVGGTDATAVTVTIVAVVARNMTEWIEANGAGGQTNEAWLKYMLGAGASGKTFNDLMFDWLGVLGYTGSLTERVAEWTEANLN